MKYRILAGVLGGVCVTSFGGAAAAQSLERVSLGLETGIFSVQSETLTLEGFTGSFDQSTTAFGIGGLGFGLNLAGGASDNVVIGLEALVSTATTELDGSQADALQATLQPRVEYVFGSGAFRPFIAGLLGYHSSSTTSGELEITSSLFSYGAGVGAHGFIADSFSIDPLLSFQALTGSRTLPSTTGGSVTPDSSGSLIALTVAFSGWFGSSPKRAVSSEEASGESEIDTTYNRGPAVGVAASQAGAAEGDGVEAQGEAAKVTVDLPDYHQLVLFARPAAVKAVKVTMIERSRSSDLRECRELELVAGDAKVPLQKVVLSGRKMVHMQAHYVAEGFTNPEALAATVAAPEASIRVCDKAWKVSAESKSTIRKFLERYRELGGVFEEAPAEPSAAPSGPAAEAPANPTNEPAAAEPPLSAAPPAAVPAAPAKAPAAPAKSPAPAAPPKPSASPAPKAPSTP
jgi:hypothetical protein